MRLLLCALILAVSACATTAVTNPAIAAEDAPVVAVANARLSPEFVTEAETDIRTVLAVQEAAWNAGNIELFMQGYWKSHDLRFASGATVTHGWQNTLDNYEEHYTTRAMMGRLTFKVLDLEIYSESDARVFGSWALERPEVGDAGGLFTLMFRRFDNGWRIVSDHTSG